MHKVSARHPPHTPTTPQSRPQQPTPICFAHTFSAPILHTRLKSTWHGFRKEGVNTCPNTVNSTDIANRIVEAILAQKLQPGARLGEQALSMLFDCSRTLVREALMQLAARGIVTVSSRRGWYVVQPSQAEAREAFEARRVIEMGLIRSAKPMAATALKRLSEHLKEEQAALAGNDVGQRSYLLGDFHVCLAECLGNQLLADTLRDFTARTTLIAMLYQSTHDAHQSCAEHVAIVAALKSGNHAEAERLMDLHIGQVQSALNVQADTDPLAELRAALTPLGRTAPGTPTAPAATGSKAGSAKPLNPKARKRLTRLAATAGTDSPTTTPPDTYLGALL
jgi:DNA-binding GntR family transcriptional regulator